MKGTGAGIAASTTLAVSQFTLSNKVGIQMRTPLTIAMEAIKTMASMDTTAAGTTDARKWKITATIKSSCVGLSGSSIESYISTHCQFDLISVASSWRKRLDCTFFVASC